MEGRDQAASRETGGGCGVSRGSTCRRGLGKHTGRPQRPPSPRLFHPCQALHRWVLAVIDWTMELSSMSMSKALEAQPTIAGGRLLEKR